MKNREKIALVVIALTMVTTVVLMLIDDFAPTNVCNEDNTEGKTPYELYPDAYENSSFNPANGYIYNNGINYENR
jgi:hypothetical protein